MAEIKQEWVGGSGKSGNNWFPENSVKDFGIGAAKPAKKKMKKQSSNARKDESLGMRTGKESTKKQSFKDRRDESYGK
jgi:hypothetical protein|tara:strand:- start:6 stop:239 length:234 start_codon:yes stop_codon:yes gene_type:complete